MKKIVFVYLLFSFATSFSQIVYWERLWYKFNSNIFDMISTSNGYLFACNADGLLKSTDDGITWSRVLTQYYYNIAVDFDDNIYLGANWGGGIIKSSDYGLTFTVSNSNAYRIRSLVVSNEGYIYAGNEDGIFYRSFDNGVTWSSISVTDVEICSIITLSNGKIFISTKGRSLFSSTDYGETWVQITHPNLFNSINSMIADSNDYLYAEHRESISKSTDLGNSWELTGFIPTYPIEPVLAIDKYNNIYNSHNGVYKSSDEGITWNYIGGPDGIDCIRIDSNKIYLGTYNALYRHNPSQPIYVGNNYLPLQVGNKWQYFGTEVTYTWYGVYIYSYFLTEFEITSDTTVNQYKYYKFHSDWVRYSEEDKKIYVWFDNTDRLYLDLTLIPETSFLQFSIFSTGGNHTYRYAEQLHGNSTIFNITSNYKGFSFDTLISYNNNLTESETYIENFGMSSFAYGMSPSYGRSSSIIMAVLYDSLGNKSLYTNHFKPEIVITPVIAINSNSFNLPLEVNHYYNRIPHDFDNGINFIDSVIFESYYSSQDSIIPLAQIILPMSNYPNYSIYKSLDTTLLKTGYSFNYRIIAKDKGIISETAYSPTSGYYQCVWDFTSDITRENQNPEIFSLFQNYPNPFNPSTSIQYAIGSWQFVTLKVYDVLGNEVATLVSEEKPAGIYEVEFKSSVGSLQLASGIYYYQLKAGDFIETKKMVLMK